METETEVKFLNVNIDDIRVKLETIGAVCVKKMVDMRRSVIDHPDRRLEKDQDAFIRVRDEGDVVTVTFKRFESQDFGGAREHEVTVSDFQTMVDIFTDAGLIVKSYQESRRETWKIGNVEIVIDEWPWLNLYIEIEGTDPEEIRDVASKLGFDWEDAVFGGATEAYRRQYPNIAVGKTIADVPSVKFGDPLPDIFMVK